MKLGGSTNQVRSLGMELEEARGLVSRSGVLGWRNCTKGESRSGKHDINGRQQRQAQAVVDLWWGGTIWSFHSKL